MFHNPFQSSPASNQPVLADAPIGNRMPPLIPPVFQRPNCRTHKGSSHQTPKTTPQPFHPVLARPSVITITIPMIAVRAFGKGKPKIIQPVRRAAENPGESQARPPSPPPPRRAISLAAAGLLRFWVFRFCGHTGGITDLSRLSETVLANFLPRRVAKPLDWSNWNNRNSGFANRHCTRAGCPYWQMEDGRWQ